MSSFTNPSGSETPRPSESGCCDLSRRDLVGMAVIIPVHVLAPHLAAAAREPLRSFDQRQMRTVEAIVARLIPTDDHGPGAREANVARYIDRALSDALRRDKGAYVAGLAALDAYARATHDAPFADLNAEKQDLVLTAVEQNTVAGFKPDSRTFFDLLRQHALEGMFADPHYGGNAGFTGWDLIGYPGPRLAVSAEQQQLEAKLPREHVSAYGAGHGGR